MVMIMAPSGPRRPVQHVGGAVRPSLRPTCSARLACAAVGTGALSHGRAGGGEQGRQPLAILGGPCGHGGGSPLDPRGPCPPGRGGGAARWLSPPTTAVKMRPPAVGARAAQLERRGGRQARLISGPGEPTLWLIICRNQLERTAGTRTRCSWGDSGSPIMAVHVRRERPPRRRAAHVAPEGASVQCHCSQPDRLRASQCQQCLIRVC